MATAREPCMNNWSSQTIDEGFILYRRDVKGRRCILGGGAESINFFAPLTFLKQGRFEELG